MFPTIQKVWHTLREGSEAKERFRFPVSTPLQPTLLLRHYCHGCKQKQAWRP